MLKLLDDDVPDVRIVAIDGVSTVLSRLWIIMSSQEINRLVKFLVRLILAGSQAGRSQGLHVSCKYRKDVLQFLQKLSSEMRLQDVKILYLE